MGRKIKADFAVIGAGSFGSWTALELLRRGRSVVLVDAFGPGNSRSSSGGETRIIRMSYGEASHYSEMAQRSLAAWRTLFDFLKRPELFQPTGALFTAPPGNEFLEHSANILRGLKIRAERFDANRLRDRFPQIQAPTRSEGLFEPNAGILLARRAVQTVAEHAINLGAAYLQMRADPQTVAEHINAPVFIYACGPWLPALFPQQIGRRIRPTRQDVFFFGAEAGDLRFQSPAMPAWVDFDSGVYALPDTENRGVKVAFDAHGPSYNPDSGSRVVPAASIARMRSRLREILPALANAPLLETRVCQYENTSNGELLIDWLDAGKTIAVGGGSGHGFKHGPAVGKYASDLAEGKAVPGCFSLASKGLTRGRSIF